jgi:hypothetical protein
VADPQPRFEGLFTLRSGHAAQNPVLPFRVVCRLLDKSNIRETRKTSSDHKPAVRDSERPISVAQPGTAKTAKSGNSDVRFGSIEATR